MNVNSFRDPSLGVKSNICRNFKKKCFHIEDVQISYLQIDSPSINAWDKKNFKKRAKNPKKKYSTLDSFIYLFFFLGESV